MRRVWPAVLTLGLLVIVSVHSLAQAPPSADAYILSARPTVNFGDSPLLPVQPGAVSYLRMNLGAFPAGGAVAKATLRLYVNAVLAPGAFDVYSIDAPWTESTLTFRNAPPLRTSVTGGQPVRVTKASANQFVLIDVTSIVQGWLTGSTPNNGLALALASATGSFSFDSKESAGTGHQPELNVVFESTTGVVTTGTVTQFTPAVTKPAPQGVSDPYIDNGTALQVGANFNIEGSGSAGTLNVLSNYQLAGTPVLGSSGGSSLFLGTGAGQINNASANLFLGTSAGQLTTTGGYNLFAGAFAGQNNTTGFVNTFVGSQSGFSNTTAWANSFLGISSGYNVTTGSWNTFLGANAGYSTTTGESNSFVGVQAGVYNIVGKQNAFLGNDAGLFSNADNNTFVGASSGGGNTTGAANTFLGMNAGSGVVTGSNNTFLGFNAGMNADPAGSNNIYISHHGVSGDNGTIRVGDPAVQTTAYMAGVNGASTNSGVPVFIDSNGKLGTGGGSVSFTQVTGTVTSPQFSGTYANPVVLSNSTNVISGSFTGNGAGLTGVASGLNWPVVTKTSDYAVQLSDFATPTTRGNYLVLTGAASHTFTLPNPPPPNGYCVAIGNVADAGINSGINAFLTVSGNGLLVDNSSVLPTMPRRTAYLYCSDGSASYYRLGYAQNGVSEIGPWLYSVDTGVVNALKTTFRNGMDFGLNTGSMIVLLPVHANTSATPTFDVNGLGAKKILKYGNQGLSAGDLSTTALALLIYDGQFWELINPQTVKSTLTGITGTVGGTALTAGSCTSGTASVTGATVGHPVSVSASDGSLPNGLIVLSAAVASSNVVTVQLCAIADVTPPANTYNVATQ
jgi:hypothetical protein